MRKVQDASACLPLVELIRLDIKVSAADNFVEVVDTNDVKPCVRRLESRTRRRLRLRGSVSLFGSPRSRIPRFTDLT